MIVVDTNILAYLYLPTEYTPQAEALLAEDAEWVAPTLWRSEFRNVLALYLRKKLLTLDLAVEIQQEVETLLQEREYLVPSTDVLNLVAQSDCSAYDCEFVALAQGLNLRLVTMDRKILHSFPAIARPLVV